MKQLKLKQWKQEYSEQMLRAYRNLQEVTKDAELMEYLCLEQEHGAQEAREIDALENYKEVQDLLHMMH